MILAGDVGATKILLEVGELRSGRWEAAHAARIATIDVTDFSATLAAFLDGWNEAKPARARITAAGFGVAGPEQGNKVKMTHRPWAVDGERIARRLGIPRVRVVNDVAAAANGIAAVAPKQLRTLQPGKASGSDPSVVLGVGTGLGVAYLVPGEGGAIVLPGEGGHMGFSPANAAQARLFDAIFRSRGRVEAEDIVSGTGLARIHEFLGHGSATGEEIGTGALAGDRDCLATIELFVDCLGNVAGDHALAVMGRGGVFLAGGVVAKLAPVIDVARLRAAFCAKGAFSARLMRVPLRAVLSDRLPVFGAARYAAARL